MSSHPELTAPATVLVVDDSSVQRNHGASLCRELGVTTVHEAANGQEALALLESLRTPPDLIIVDLEMPTMDGPELMAQLSQRGFDIPVVVASSRERALLHSVRHMGSALGLRVLGAVQKPLTFELLSAILRNWGAAPSRQPQRPKRAPVDAGALSAALDRGEIAAYYQPQVDIATGAVRGVEALARWRHPTLGLIPPDQFIPLAEQHGLIHQVTLQIVNQAMLQAAIWHARDLDFSIALNLSPLLLNRADLVQEIAGLQQLHGVRPERVVLEVTESTLFTELAVALGVLARLRLRGFRLSLDDYGTGFSSMQQLAQIPFTELKIDRSFVSGAHERESLQVMLKSALAMANELGLVTVAEGVESTQDLWLLKDYGCTLAQGWLFAKAMPAQEVEAWVRSHVARRHEYLAPDVVSRALP